MMYKDRLDHDDRFSMICEAEERLQSGEVDGFRTRLILELSTHISDRDDLAAAIRRALPEEAR